MGRFRYFDHRRSRYVLRSSWWHPMLQAASLFGVQKQFAKAAWCRRAW